MKNSALLQNDKAVRKYINKALAKEAGFSSTQRFTNVFFARTGMPASFFIQQIKKESMTGLNEKVGINLTKRLKNRIR